MGASAPALIITNHGRDKEMISLHLTDSEFHTLTNCIAVAAERFRDHAIEFTKIKGHERLSDQFERQYTDSVNLRDKIQAIYDGE